jgi:hypothetical protein
VITRLTSNCCTWHLGRKTQRTRCNQCSPGARAAPNRPEPYPTARRRGVRHACQWRGGWRVAGELFAAGRRWRCPTQRLRRPAVTAALGGLSAVLAAFTDNTNGGKPYAVRSGSPAGLPTAAIGVRPGAASATRPPGCRLTATRRARAHAANRGTQRDKGPAPPTADPSRAQASTGTRAAADRESQPSTEQGQATPARPRSSARRDDHR